jgi:stearoyl-CoA desaturase (delta-9 desaturase)
MSATALLDREVAPEPPEPGSAGPVGGRRREQALTGVIAFGPLVVTLAAIVGLMGRALTIRDLVLAVLFYVVAGHGVTVGFHRLFAHRSFRASRPLKIVLAVSGSMAFQGPLIGWVADHRRHHAHSDRAGDPHSPHAFGAGSAGLVRGLWHAHMGWLFAHDPTCRERYTRDLTADADLVAIDRAFPVWCVLSLALPFAAGWLVGGTLAAAVGALIWAGAVRVCVLHHVTWSINSVCHTFGRRDHATKDRSTNVGALALLAMGESWHNNHHAFPTSARHGLGPGQHDSSAVVIDWCERIGWATDVRRPDHSSAR